MQAEVINTGSELLLGLVQNKHLAWLAGELAPLGITIDRQVCVPDGPPIREALREALDRADVVIATGGLGPTSDDMTRDAAADTCGPTMPGWLQAVVAVNPVTLLVTAIRDIMAGTPDLRAILLALLAPGLIAAVFGPITMWLYRKER